MWFKNLYFFTFTRPFELSEDQLEAHLAEHLFTPCASTEQSHFGWLQMEKNQGGIKGITYPMVADTNKTISKNYDVLAGDYYYDDNDMYRQSVNLLYAEHTTISKCLNHLI